MRITEPATLITDWLLGGLGVWCGLRLLSRAREGRRRFLYGWSLALLSMALGAFLGGASHGFALHLDSSQQAFIWRGTLYAIGFASFFLLHATAYAGFSGGIAHSIVLAAAVKLAFYLVWMSFHDEFRYVIYDYAPSMAAVAAVHAWIWSKSRNRGSLLIVAAVLVSFGAAAIQLAGIAPHPSFNHNDLYHVIQMIAVWLFYAGASRMRSI